MSRYSFEDTRELSCDVDEDTRADGPIDAFGRDVEDFDRDCSADSLDDYELSLMRDVDAREDVSMKNASARAHNVSAVAWALCVDAARATSQRALFDDAVTRYLRTHVDGAHVGARAKS
jgi:hypothetical protein